MDQNKSVVIIGAGVIGMSTAYELAKRGVTVTVVDKGGIGLGCSYGNAGWLTPCFSMPLPMPGMFLKSIKWLLDPDSPLYIKPSMDPLLVKWLIRFSLSMRQNLMLQSVKALTELSKLTLKEFAELEQKNPGSFSFQQKGLLMVSQSKEGVRAAIHEMELVAPYGVPGSYLEAQQIKELEPALTAPLLGGVYFSSEAHVEPLAVVQTLARECEKLGVKIITNCEVYDVIAHGDRLAELHTTQGTLKPEQVVLSAGSWSNQLAKKFHLNVPVLGGKGYALIVNTFSPAPKIPLMLVEKKIAITPRVNSVRLAGTLELVNQDFSITPRRVNAIIKGAGQFLSLPEEPQVQEVWRGLRPCTPDGVPIIGRSSRFQNLFLNTGHQMLGLQSSLGSGRLAAELLTGESPSFDPQPFCMSRF